MQKKRYRLLALVVLFIISIGLVYAACPHGVTICGTNYNCGAGTNHADGVCPEDYGVTDCCDCGNYWDDDCGDNEDTCGGGPCVPNCNCAANTCIGETCRNSCNTGDCDGTKVCGGCGAYTTFDCCGADGYNGYCGRTGYIGYHTGGSGTCPASTGTDSHLYCHSDDKWYMCYSSDYNPNFGYTWVDYGEKYSNYCCDNSQNEWINVGSNGCCASANCDSGEYCRESDHSCQDLPLCAESNNYYGYNPQEDGEDLYNECTVSWSCSNICTRQGADGSCSGGSYACDNDAIDYVSAGSVCSNGNEVANTACNTAWQCTSNDNANNYYGVGYGYQTQGYCDGSGNCDYSGAGSEPDDSQASCECEKSGSQGTCSGGETDCWGYNSNNVRAKCCGDDGNSDDWCDGGYNGCFNGRYRTNPDTYSYICTCGGSNYDVGGEVALEQCCGDDSGENYISNPGLGTDACCDNANDCVDSNGNCQDGVAENPSYCADAIDNNCDGEADYDGFTNGLINPTVKGDSGCPVGVTDIAVDNSNPCPGETIIVTCTLTVGSVRSIDAYIDSTLCDAGDWNGNQITFTCTAKSTTGQQTVKCSVNTDKSYKTGTDQTEQITVGGVDCCGNYGDSQTCGDDNACEWCPSCSGTKYSGGVDRCVSKGSCSYYCWKDSCGAECDDTQGGCSNYCTGDTRYYDVYCNSECSCVAGSNEDCNAEDCTGDRICDGVDTDSIKEVSDNYGCTAPDCVVTGTMDCSSTWTCNSLTECNDQLCAGDTYKCYNDGIWKWGAPSSSETICGDGLDNDCDGLIDCDDDNCPGLLGPNSVQCCRDELTDCDLIITGNCGEPICTNNECDTKKVDDVISVCDQVAQSLECADSLEICTEIWQPELYISYNCSLTDDVSRCDPDYGCSMAPDYLCNDYLCDNKPPEGGTCCYCYSECIARCQDGIEATTPNLESECPENSWFMDLENCGSP